MSEAGSCGEAEWAILNRGVGVRWCHVTGKPRWVALLLTLSITVFVATATAVDQGAIVQSDVGRRLDKYLTRAEVFGFSGLVGF